MYRPTKLGGLGIVVEIDDSKFGHRKYHKGHRIEGKWVFGIYDCWKGYDVKRDSTDARASVDTVEETKLSIDTIEVTELDNRNYEIAEDNLTETDAAESATSIVVHQVSDAIDQDGYIIPVLSPTSSESTSKERPKELKNERLFLKWNTLALKMLQSPFQT
ncbi:hypothetical protein QE152_g38501 [Popillia japonica]|uniref:Uncharacterized protein n=1 Tax=Popillia japonica TaxID=7064 RepID=A0AAW1HWF7_POPJA